MKKKIGLKQVVSLMLSLLLAVTCISGSMAMIASAEGIISAGTMSEHPNGGNTTSVYFTMAENAAPYKTDWSLEYKQVSTDAIKIIRGGTTYNVGIVDRPLIIKYSATEYYLKLEGWTIGDYAPIQNGDIIVVGGQFAHPDGACTLSIDTTYIEYLDGAYTFSTSMPGPQETPSLGAMTAMSDKENNGYNGGGFYFRLASNAGIPLNTDWSVRYTPVNAGTIQRYRDGDTTDVTNTAAETIVKYGETDWYIEDWATGGGLTQEGDILIIEGEFAGHGVNFTIDKTYILYKEGTLYFSTVWPLAHEVGSMQADAEHLTPAADGSFYFTLGENAEIPYAEDWSIGYYAMEAGTIQRIRDGVTTDVTNTGGAALKKFSPTGWYLEGWTTKGSDEVGGLSQDGDILVVEGDFNGAVDGTGVTFTISKTYIYYKDGQLIFSETMPQIPTGPVKIEAGNMSEHVNGYANGSFHFTLEANENVPYDDWNLRYKPVNAGTIQRIRGGVTTDVTNTEAETLVKYGATDWYLESWATGGGLTENGDIFVIEGDFEGHGVIVTIAKTYVMYYDGLLTFSTTMPEIPTEPVIIPAGKLSSHTKGYDAGGFYFTMEENSGIPYDSDWTVRYTPVNAGTIQRIRAGVTTDVTNVEAETLVKYGAKDWHLEAWATGGGLTKNGDIFVIEGDFVGHGISFTVEKTYVLYYDGVVTFSSTMPTIPTEPTVISAGKLASHEKGYDGGGFYFTMETNSAIPYDSDWAVRYTPVNPGTIQRIRDGVTTDVTNTGAETLVKYGAKDWHLEAWATDGGLVKDGDILVVEGIFAGNGVSFYVEKTYVKYASGLVFFADNLSDLDKGVEVLSAGYMAEHTKGYEQGSFYFSLPANSKIPYNSDWSVRYKPVNDGTILRIRNGVTKDVTNTEAETLVKYGAGDWYLEAWATGGGLTQDGDILVVDGTFAGNGVSFKIEKTYIMYYAGMLTFSKTMPKIPNGIEAIAAGTMTEHPNGYNAGSFYFTLPANDEIPYNSDWSVRYKPMGEGVILRIRNGETKDVTNVAAETLVKYGETDWHLEGWATDGGLTQEGDVFVIEGVFVGNGVRFSIDKSYVLYSRGNVSFYTEDEWNALDEQEEEEKVKDDTEKEISKPTYYTKTVLKPWVVPVFATVAGCIILGAGATIVVIKRRKIKK